MKKSMGEDKHKWGRAQMGANEDQPAQLSWDTSEHEQGLTRVNQHNQVGIKEQGQTGQQMNRDEHELGPVSTIRD